MLQCKRVFNRKKMVICQRTKTVNDGRKPISNMSYISVLLRKIEK